MENLILRSRPAPPSRFPRRVGGSSTPQICQTHVFHPRWGLAKWGILTSGVSLTHPVPDNSTRVSTTSNRTVVVLANLSLSLLNSSTTNGDRPAPTTSAQDALMDSFGRFQLTPSASFVIP